MTVKELIKLLKKCSPDREVVLPGRVAVEAIWEGLERVWILGGNYKGDRK